MSIRSSPTGTAAAPQGDRLKTVLSAGLGRLSLHCTPCNDPMNQTEKQLAIIWMTRDGLALQFASLAMRGDRQVVLAAVAQNGDALRYASAAMQTDPDVVRAAGRVP